MSVPARTDARSEFSMDIVTTNETSARVDRDPTSARCWVMLSPWNGDYISKPRRRPAARPPLRPAAFASSRVNSWAVPCACAALPPRLASAQTSDRSIAANPLRLRVLVASSSTGSLVRSVSLMPALLASVVTTPLGVNCSNEHVRQEHDSCRELRDVGSAATKKASAPGREIFPGRPGKISLGANSAPCSTLSAGAAERAGDRR
jgi:hypothetical protein